MSQNLIIKEIIIKYKMDPAEVRFHKVTCKLAYRLQTILRKLEADGVPTLSSIIINAGVSYIEIYKDKKKMITKFIEVSYPYWDQVRDRNLDFFLDDKKGVGFILSRFLPLAGLDAVFKQAVEAQDKDGKKYVSEVETLKIWDFFTAMINISISFCHDNSSPISTVENGKKISKYTKNAFADQHKDFPKIDILKEALKSEEAARKHGNKNFSLRDKLVFPMQ